jgi:hypothetical protein
MVWKVRPWMACSFSVRKNLSMTPLVSGSAAKA